MKEEIQNRTLDKGWKAMSELLDQEMPVARRKRRFVWWWLLLLLLPAAAWGGWFWLNQPATTPGTPLHSQPLPMAAKPAPSPGKPATGNLAQAPAAAGSNTMSAISEPSVISSKNTFNLSVSNKTTVEPILQANTPDNQPAIAQHTQASEPAPIGHLLPLQAIPTEFVTLEFVPQKDQVLKAEHLLPAIPGAKPLAGTSEAITPKHKKLSFGPGMYTATESFQQLNGLSAGLAAKWQMSRRWSIRTGLFATHYQTATSTQPVVSLVSDQYSKATELQVDVTDGFGNVLSPYTGSPALDQAVLVPISSMLWLEMPLQAGWQLTRRWGVQAGIFSTCLLQAKSANSNYSGNLILALNSDQARSNVSQAATTQLDRWRFDAQIGGSCLLTKRLECNLSLRIPMVSANLFASQKRQESLGSGFTPSTGNFTGSTNTLSQPLFSVGLNYFVW